MKCPDCPEVDSRVVETRYRRRRNVYLRRRECRSCGRRFNTEERIVEDMRWVDFDPKPPEESA